MPETRAQLRLAHAVAEGNSKAMPKNVAREMINAFHGHKVSELPERASTREKMHKNIYGR